MQLQQMHVIRGHTTWLKFFGAHVYILFIIRVKILVLIQWSLNGHKGPPATLIILTIEPRIVILFWARNPIYFEHVFSVADLGATHNHIPLEI